MYSNGAADKCEFRVGRPLVLKFTAKLRRNISINNIALTASDIRVS